MKLIIILSLFVGTILFNSVANSQNIVIPAPLGFDIVRSDIPHGKIDSVIYNSKTVGNNRKALVYLPPDTVFIAWHWWRRKGMAQRRPAAGDS
jgi:hypothetical protein